MIEVPVLIIVGEKEDPEVQYRQDITGVPVHGVPMQPLGLVAASMTTVID